jgi:hypothetical protein
MLEETIEQVNDLQDENLSDDNTNVVNEGGEESLDENANADSLRPGGGTAGAGDSRAQRIAAIVTNLTSLSDDDLNGFHKSLDQIGKEADGVGDVAGSNKSSIAAKPSNASADFKKVVKEDLEKVFANEEGLSPTFVNEATTLFEAAVTARTALESTRIEEEYETRLAEATDTMVSEFAERLDTYLDYLAEKFLEDNKLAIDSGVRAELSESFIKGIREVFAEHYVDVPEDKVDIVEALTSEVEDLRNQLNEQINENIGLTSATQKAELGTILSESTDGMSDSDAERLKDLAEDIDYDTTEDFRNKVKLLRERFFDGKPSGSSTGLVIEEVGLVEDEDGDVTSPAGTGSVMDRYVAQIKEDLKR